MWKPIVTIVLLANILANVSGNGEGWGWSGGGGGGNSQPGPQPGNQQAAQPSNGNYWWMSSNPFQKPANHPGIEKGDGGGAAYNQPQPQPSYQQKPSYGGNQQSSPSISFQPSGPSSSSYNQPQVQPPQYQPAPGPAPSAGGSYGGPSPVKPQVSIQPVQSGSSYGGSPVPVKPQVQIQPFPAPSGPSGSYGPAPVKPVPVNVPAPSIPSYANPAPAQNNYVVPKPQAPVPVAPTYGQNGNGWGAPQPQQNYNPPSIDFDECKLTNKADCHKGSQPNPSYNQVDYNRPPPPSTNYAPPPPSNNYSPPPTSNYAPPPSNNYAPPPPKPQYQQQISPQPVPAPQPPKPSYNPPPPKPSYNNPPPSQGYQQPPPPQNNYQNPPQQNYPEPPPYPGCPAAMLCTPDNQCNAEGVISETPLQLSEAEKVYRVALSTCSSPSTGVVGVCCRDPNYKDPWPDMNGGGGGQHHHHDGGHKGGGNNGGHSPALQPSYQQQQPSNNFNGYAVPQAAAVPQQLQAATAVASGEYTNCSLEEDCIQMNACVSGPSKAEDDDDDIPLLEINIRSNSNLKKCRPDFDGFPYVCCKRNRPQVQQSYAPPTKEFNFGDRRIGPSAYSLNQGSVPATYEKPATENQSPTPENQRQSGQTQRISVENQGPAIISQRPAQVQQLPNEPLQPGNVNQGAPSQPPVYKTLQLPRLAGDSVIFPNSQVKFESDPRIIQGPFSIIIPKPEQIRPGERIRIRLNSNVGASTVLGPDTPVQFVTSSNTNGAESPAPSRVTIRDEPLVPLPFQSRPSGAGNDQVAPSSERISSEDSTIPASLQRRSQPPLGSSLGFTNQEISRVTITDQPSVPRPINTLTRRPINPVPNQPSSFTVRDESLLTLQLPRIESIQSEQKLPNTASLPETTSQISLIELDKNANYVVVTPKSPTTQKTTTTPTPKPFFPGFTNPPPVQPYTQENPAQKLTLLPITVDDTSSESGTAPSNSLFNSFGTNRKVEYILSSSGEKVRVPSQYYEPPSLTPEDFFKLIQLPAPGSNPSSLSGQNGSNKKDIQFFSPVAKSTPSDHVESCPRNMKCLSENLCSTPDPSEGDSDDFDIRSQMKKPKRQKCRQPNLPVQGYCCYLRDDYVAAQQAQRDNPLGGAIGVRKNQNTCGVRRPGGSSLRSDINTNTTFGEFPWQVLILRNGESSCGGAILDKRTILTTAKCLSGVALDDIKILVGEWDTGSSDEIKPHQEISPKTVYIHPGFKYIGDTPVNDLALIVTSQKLKYEYHISPVCLPDAITKFDDQRCIATGWFSPTPGARNVDKTLRKVHLPVVPVRRCKEKLRDTTLDLTNTHRTSICAGGESTTTTCTDHIGSPLVCEDEYTGTYALAGLASWSDCRDKTSRPALFTSIPVHIEWIAVIRQKERDELSKSA